MEALEPAAFAELSEIDDGVSDADSDADVAVDAEYTAPAAADGANQDDVDIESMGLAELEARITEVERSIDVKDEADQGEGDGNDANGVAVLHALCWG